MSTVDITNSKALQTVLQDTDIVAIVRKDPNGATSTWYGLKGSAITGVLMGQWAPNTEYFTNNVVIYQGALFQASTSFTTGTKFDTTNFTQLTPYPVLVKDNNGNIVLANSGTWPTTDPKVSGALYKDATTNAVMISTGS